MDHSENEKNINYAQVETKRPSRYTSFKYWGKKPHNIWSKYIETYSKKKDIVLDPFSGSNMTAFEAVKLGRKAIVTDLNPWSTFLMDFFKTAWTFNENKFISKIEEINNIIGQKEEYQKFFYHTSNDEKHEIWCWHVNNDNDSVYFIGTKKNSKNKELLVTDKDQSLYKEQKNIVINCKIPDSFFPKNAAYTDAFLKKIGGLTYSFLWSRRNLWVMSEIFQIISNEKCPELKQQLLFTFLKSSHLASKMCIPRDSKNANRKFSTSWGRSAFLIGKKSFEHNFLKIFINSSEGKQSTSSCLRNLKTFLPTKPKFYKITKKDFNPKNYDIVYGNVNIMELTTFINIDTVNFIITDPPYGDLVRYFDLSCVWLSWLRIIDNSYWPVFSQEITIDSCRKITTSDFSNRLQNSFSELYKVLKNKGKAVFTFHNKDIDIWNQFIKAIHLAGFSWEKGIYQENKRQGECVVASPLGTSGADVYVRCGKIGSNSKDANSKIDALIIQEAINIIAERMEPTPFELISIKITERLYTMGYKFGDYKELIPKIFMQQKNKIFCLSDDKNRQDLWFLKDPQLYINHLNIPLGERVEKTIVDFLKQRQSASFDEVLGEVFLKFPNGLTPIIKSITHSLNTFAKKGNKKWLYDPSKSELNLKESLHSVYICKIIKIGQQTGHKVYVGKREQGDIYNGEKIKNYIDIEEIDYNYKHLRNVDVVFFKNDIPVCLFEIENSTDFYSALIRTMEDKIIPKIMVVPDSRKEKLNSLIKNNMTNRLFSESNWFYCFYSEIDEFRGEKFEDLWKKIN